jgi:hypothetical protein
MSSSSWQVFLGGDAICHATGRQAAMNRIDRPYRKGLGKIVNTLSGESWERRGGSWHQITTPVRRRKGLQRQGVPA